jgi:hypothetical protein
MNAQNDPARMMYQRTRRAALGRGQAVAHVERVLAAGTKRSTYRLLRVACPECQGLLLEVFPSPAGPVVMGRRDLLLGFEDTPMTGPFLPRRRGEWVKQLIPDDYPDVPIRLACQCREAHVSVAWIHEQLTSGRRRVIWRGE